MVGLRIVTISVVFCGFIVSSRINEVLSFSSVPRYESRKQFVEKPSYNNQQPNILRHIQSTCQHEANTITYSKNNNINDNNNSKGGGKNFLQDVFQSAFANDRELLSKSNKRVGMLDEGIDGDDDAFLIIQSSQKTKPELTPIQQAWRQKMGLSSSSTSTGTTSQFVQDADLIGSSISIDLYLSGVPNKDPSNDLYASKTNISLRDRSVGQVLPSIPTISNVYIEFLPNNKCSVSTTTTTPKSIPSSTSSTDSDDTLDNDERSMAVDDEVPSTDNTNNNNDKFVNTNIVGDWKLSDDGKQIRFRINVYGFQRTIQTKGTIQKIYWSQGNDSITETSTLYTIPEGWLYFETELLKRSNGSIQWMNSISPSITSVMSSTPNLARTRSSTTSASSLPNGIIKIEQSTGMFGIASKMVPCGKFVVVSC